jgi:hypothetical protein
MGCSSGFPQARGLDKISGIGGLGGAEESNFVAAASPALRPPAGRKGFWRGLYGRGCRPCLSGVLGRAVEVGGGVAHLFQRALKQLPCGRQTQMLLSTVATEGHEMEVAVC